ncbi:phosphoenolpyruvate carboxykinase (ATP) [Anaeromicrobium sediminis]|uniref:phosphoenolpyruvate carboxykinase (ATP) n=1 Tax=Anaeromicrobium sediminis TaxID=1478221 RepID=A0A267MMI6_9FIRM|nr:phosphoenolpyruvate carboxykinase (ATP) [Anaeromicrobium sediminis]PAB60128.1 phosphoenolpyruvate carboxykinase (ATP) [Anaeromicrobium sediminis]
MTYLINDKLFKNVMINPNVNELRKMSKHMETTTEFNSPCYVTEVRNRSAKNTYIVDDISLGVDQQGISRDKADKIVKEVKNYLKNKEVVRIDRKMGMDDRFSFNCRLYITKEYSRIAYMWNNTLFDPIDTENPDFVSIYVPEWPERIMIAYPEEGITFILGSDYFGESKKSFLRMAMHKVKNMGGLGLHAGSKVLRVKDKNENLKDVGFIMFGLSGTGKTTLTIHDHGLSGEEKAIIRQDDVIFMDQNGYCAGSENGFFIKTEGLDEGQKVLYTAATSENSIFENVKINENGKVDFDDTTLTSNGRGVVLRNEIENTDNSVDLEKANKIIFITRRNDIIPPVMKLNASQAVTAFMLGESIETSAGDPTKAGQSKRCVGTNPFIIGPEAEEGYRLHEILKRNPDMECFILNTGSVGAKEDHKGEKITIKVSTTIMKEIAKDNIKWEADKEWGYLLPKHVEGIDIKKYNPRNHYTEEEYRVIANKLRVEREQWLTKFENANKEVAIAI